MNKPKDTPCGKGMFMNATYDIAFPVTQLDVCILLSSIVFTVYTDLLRMQRVPAELLLPTGETSEPHIHNTEASPAKVSLHMKIHSCLYEYDIDGPRGRAAASLMASLQHFTVAAETKADVADTGTLAWKSTFWFILTSSFYFSRLRGDHSEWVGECVFVCAEDPDG